MKPDFSRFDLRDSALLRGWKVAPPSFPKSKFDQRYFLGSTELRIEPHFFLREEDHQRFLTETQDRYQANLGNPIESGKPKNVDSCAGRALVHFPCQAVLVLVLGLRPSRKAGPVRIAERPTPDGACERADQTRTDIKLTDESSWRHACDSADPAPNMTPLQTARLNRAMEIQISVMFVAPVHFYLKDSKERIKELTPKQSLQN